MIASPAALGINFASVILFHGAIFINTDAVIRTETTYSVYTAGSMKSPLELARLTDRA